MIALDANPVIDVLRGRSVPASESLKSLLATSVGIVVPGVIRFEVLQGIRTQKELRLAERLQLSFDHLTLPSDVEFYERAARRYRSLRKRGITIRSSIDTLIAGYCIETETELLTSERDFIPFAEHFGLKLVADIPEEGKK